MSDLRDISLAISSQIKLLAAILRHVASLDGSLTQLRANVHDIRDLMQSYGGNAELTQKSVKEIQVFLGDFSHKLAGISDQMGGLAATMRDGFSQQGKRIGKVESLVPETADEVTQA